VRRKTNRAGKTLRLSGSLPRWEADDERLPNSPQALADAGVRIRIETVDVGDPHPNTYRLTLRHARSIRHPGLRAVA
jgi:L-serine dehydratase